MLSSHRILELPPPSTTLEEEGENKTEIKPSVILKAEEETEEDFKRAIASIDDLNDDDIDWQAALTIIESIR
jgi:hypothetical protein